MRSEANLKPNRRKTVRTMSTWCPSHSRQTITNKSAQHKQTRQRWNAKSNGERGKNRSHDPEYQLSRRCSDFTGADKNIFCANGAQCAKKTSTTFRRQTRYDSRICEYLANYELKMSTTRSINSQSNSRPPYTRALQ